MRKLACLCLILLLTAGLAFGVSAQPDSGSIQSNSVISENGSCQVNLTLTITLAQAADLSFPIPASAENVTLNGSAAKVSGSDTKMVALQSITGSGGGTYTMHIGYMLPAVVSTGEDGLLLTLDLLSPGFRYVLSQFSFSITLPGEITAEPIFRSGYYHETTMEHLTIETEGNTIRGSYKGAVHDSETLAMTLPVDDAMFPRTAITARMMSMLDLVTVIIVGLTIIYFFAFMCPPIKRAHPRYTAPEGITAGEVDRWLTGGSMDLTMLVLSWAQMGYLRIRCEHGSRVILHKRMEMGNERSVFENQTFSALFGGRTSLDATGSHYARVFRDVKAKTRHPKDVFNPRSGNPYLFRILCICAAFLAGIMLGDTFAPHSMVVRIFTGIVTATLSVVIQTGAAKLILRQRRMLHISLLCCAVWLLVSLLCGDWLVGIGMVIFQFLAGLALAYGGRRTELGSQHMFQLLGLRNHTKTAATQELTRLMKTNPTYFHNVAPYALAMNTDRAFARRFGKLRIPECSYLTDGRDRQYSATEWMNLLRRTVKAMDARSQSLSNNRSARRR